MKETGMYVLRDKQQRHKLLQDQPWPLTEEVLNRLREQGYVFQTAEVEKRRAFFVKIE